MAECPKCGVALNDDELVCPSCGTDVASATASFEPVSDEGAEGVEEELFDEGPVLVVRKGPQPGERFYLDRAKLTIGRDPDADIFLNDMTVSREHAVLRIAPGVVTASDAGSLNGTYVNGVCVDSAELADGDVLQIGTFQMLFFAGRGASG